MINDLINQMVEAGVHLGHQTRKWHPSMKKYLLKDKAGIHIINLEETEKCLDKACSFLADLARRMLTNMSTIRKSIERLVYLEGIEKSPEFKSMSKKELAALDRERQKLERNLQGIRNMGGAPDAMVAIGADHEDIAIREAHRLNIPVCVLVDTNADPKEIDFPIPGNDDAVRSIRLILDCIVKAINEGKGASAEA